jgi:hypothetical protein
MAIDPVKLDNPLDLGAVPKEPMPIEFPARYAFNIGAVGHTLILSIAVASAIYFGGYFAPRIAPTLAPWLCDSTRVAHIAFVLSIMIRWATKSDYAYWMGLMSAMLALASTAYAVGLAKEGAVAFCALLTNSSIWIMVEIGSHFESIDHCILRHDPTVAAHRRNRSIGQLEILATLIAIGMCLSLWSPMRLAIAPAIIITTILIAYFRSAKIAKYPIQFLLLTLQHYFAYPNSSTLVPGLIRSCAPQTVLRAVPIALYLVVITTLPLALPVDGNVLINMALWGAIGIGLGASILVLAASFTAWPVHFDVNRTPFKVIINQLRGKEKTDE